MEQHLSEWRRVNEAGLEEVLMPLHVEIVKMLVEILLITTESKDKEKVEASNCIEAMILYVHHELLHPDVPLNSEDDVRNYSKKYLKV